MSDAAQKKCFIAMPVSMSKDHVTLYGDDNHWRHVLDEVIVPAVKEAGFVPVEPTAQGTSVIHARIISELSECQMVVCDLSTLNPNVLFELGVRTSLNLPIALVAELETRLPFDVGSLNTHFYDPTLSSWKTRGEISKLAAHIKESEAACAGVNPLWKHFGYEKRAEAPDAPGLSAGDARLEIIMDEVRTIRAMSEAQMMSLVDNHTSFDHSLAARHRSGGSAPFDLYIDALERFDASKSESLFYGYIQESSDSGVVYASESMSLEDRARIDDLAARYEVRVVPVLIPRLTVMPDTVAKQVTPMRRWYQEPGFPRKVAVDLR